jgi:hypothetical protein
MKNLKSFIPFYLPVAVLLMDFYFNLLNFLNFQYTSDGFHVYSFLLNIINFGIPYEGPRFESLLGIHSYLTAIVFAIPVGIFKSPIVLVAGVSILNFISCFYIIKIGRNLGNSLVEVLGPIIFLSLHFVRDTRNGTMYMFQPDWIAIPIVIAISYKILSKNINGTLLTIFLLMLNKEEWVLQLPLLLGFFYLVLDRKEFIESQMKKIVLIYLLGSMISLATNFYFRNLNTNDFPVELSFENVLFDIVKYSPRAAIGVIIAFAEYFLVLFLLATFMLIQNKSKQGYYILLLVLLITEFRFLIVNTAVYKDPFNGSFFWSSNAFVTPVMIIALLLMIPMPSKSKFDFPLLTSILVALMLAIPFWKFADDFYKSRVIGASDFVGQRIKYISSPVDRIGVFQSFNRFRCFQDHRFSKDTDSIHDYFISSHRVMAPFMKDSHVPIEWALQQEDFDEIAANSIGFVISENDINQELLGKLSELNFYLIPNSCSSSIFIFERAQ